MQLAVAQDLASLQNILVQLARSGKRIGFVPTMGALHEGHLSLVKTVQQRVDAVIVSIFVNPTQFGKNEDFSKYPRTLEADMAKLREVGATAVYAPSVADMYPEGFATVVSPGEIGKVLDGAHRPGHFEGVCTVVAKLLLRVLPHVAAFGEKDYQQICVISQMVKDLDLPIEIIGVPTMREKDGLAMSSRNVYLSGDERAVAPKLYETLNSAALAIKGGQSPAEAAKKGAEALAALGFKVDYLELREAYTLKPMPVYQSPARLLVAAWLGKTRLIDNIAV